MNKKIIFFLGTMKRGGAERVISILSRAYAKKGWETMICVLLDNQVMYEIDESTKVVDLTQKKKTRIQSIPGWLSGIRKLIKDENPKVVLSFAARINILVLLASIGLKAKIVVSERNDPNHDGRGFLADVMTRILYLRANAVVFQTKRVRDYFGRTIRKRSIVIPNPIEVNQKRENPDVNKIVTVGRLESQKNQAMLLTAFAKLCEKHSELKLYLYGEGSLKQELQLQAYKLNISEKVYFEGNVPQVHEKIKDASFFVLPSDYEGLSNALLEAMKMGIPCISTDCAGSDEFIENGYNGLLVPVGNEQSLYRAMEKFVQDEKFRIKCGENGKITTECLNPERIFTMWNETLG